MLIGSYLFKFYDDVMLRKAFSHSHSVYLGEKGNDRVITSMHICGNCLCWAGSSKQRLFCLI